RRPPRRRHLHADRDGKAQRRRPAGLACRRARPPAGSSRQAHRRAVALELEARARAKSRRVVVSHQTDTHAVNDRLRGVHRTRTLIVAVAINLVFLLLDIVLPHKVWRYFGAPGHLALLYIWLMGGLELSNFMALAIGLIINAIVISSSRWR